MAHPFANHRQTKVEHSRVGSITKGYADGGAVAAPVASASQAPASPAGKRDGGKVEGRASGGRADRPARRARGGRTSKKGSTVNILIGSQAPPSPNGPAGVGAGVPPPMPAPRPPMPMPPPGMGAPGMAGPGGAPPGLRHDGGRAYASGGRIKSGPAFEEGKRLGTQVQHAPGKNDGKDIGRGKPVTYASGGPVEAPAGKKGMGPKLPGGGRGGLARLAKAHRAAAGG